MSHPPRPPAGPPYGPGGPGGPWQGPSRPPYVPPHLVNRPGFPGGPSYPYPMMRAPGPVVPTARRKLVVIMLLALCGLGFVASMITPIIAFAGQPWNSGFFLWQWTPQLLGGEAETFLWVFVIYFVTTLTAAVLALLGAAGVLGKVPATLFSVVLGVDLLASLFMLLVVAAAAAEPRTTPGPAVFLNLAAVVLGIVVLSTKVNRAVWVRDSAF